MLVVQRYSGAQASANKVW